MLEPKFLETPIEEPVEPKSAEPPPAPAPAPETKVETAPEAPAKEPEKAKDPKEAAYWRGLADEREKRRVAEREKEYWRGRAEAAHTEDPKRAQQAREDEFLVDPVNFTDKMIQQRIEAAVINDRWARSIYSVEREHKDWGEKRDKFLKMAEEDPTLEARVTNHPDPARYAYEYVRQREAAGTPLDIEAERKRIRAEVEADLRKEMALSAAGAIPPTLAGAAGDGGSGSAGQVPDVNDLFKDKSF